MPGYIMNRMKTLILMHLVILTMTQGGDSVQLIHMGEPVLYNTAESLCTSSSSHLIDDSLSDQSLKQYMRVNRLRSVWMGIKFARLRNWMWQDGERLSSVMPRDYGCGGVSTVTGSLRAMACNYEWDHGVVCEHDNVCPEQISSEQCFYEGGRTYTFKCGVNNWYEARDICNDFNSTIAKLNTTEKINALLNATAGIPSTELCEIFWIGAQKEDWYTSRSGGKSSVTRTRWGQHHPAVALSCAIGTLRNDIIIWLAVNCAQAHMAVCMTYPMRENSSTWTTTTFDRSALDYETTIRIEANTEPTVSLGVVLILAGTGFVIIAACVVSIYCCIQRRKKSKKRKLKSSTETSPTADQNDSFPQQKGHEIFQAPPLNAEEKQEGWLAMNSPNAPLINKNQRGAAPVFKADDQSAECSATV